MNGRNSLLLAWVIVLVGGGFLPEDWRPVAGVATGALLIVTILMSLRWVRRLEARVDLLEKRLRKKGSEAV